MIYPISMNVMKLHKDAIIPTRANEGDAGLDLYALEDTLLKPAQFTAIEQPGFVPYTIYSFLSEPQRIRTGIAIELPRNSYGLIRDRSSLANKSLMVVGGVIDEPYRGELIVLMHNLTGSDFWFEPGTKVAQLIVSPYIPITPYLVNKLSESKRGDQGFGSSGR